MRGYTASLDPARAAQAAWSCQLGFDNGVFASLVYSGFAHFDSDELMGWIGEMGQKKDAAAYWTSRMALQGDELKLKNARNYGGESVLLPNWLRISTSAFFSSPVKRRTCGRCRTAS